ncbi:hypothetical protein [Sinorhizobium meliloti]|uniref:hypothetical protein n=1 Tax=Rhizobium meliloti TaxID=382 RepID=UPI000FD8D8E5|nr:hypothetical protein [Sinorhizobium meliloti]RVO34831.1 hypothetical protein CN095_17070 [Sinorhizobium meliloti]
MDKKNEALDLVWGIDEIGKLIGRNFQQTYHMIRSGHLPMVKQVGERYVASRRKLIAFFMEEDAA